MQFILQRKILWFIHSTYCHIGIYALIFESFLFDSFHYMAPVQRGPHMFPSLWVIECQQYRVKDQIIYHLFLFKEKDNDPFYNPETTFSIHLPGHT